MSSIKQMNREIQNKVTNKKHNLQIVEAEQGTKTLQLEIHTKIKETNHRMLAMKEEIDHQLLII
jgi:ABC-type thiamine transport system substrate-binding protein